MRRKIWSAEDVRGFETRLAGQAGGEGSSEESISDVAAKEDVRAIGRTRHDLPLYRFRYKGQPEEYAGVMAQDVLKVVPEAVSVGPDGYYRVNYGMLGIRMVRLDDGAVLGGGEGSSEQTSDLRLKDIAEVLGTVAVAAGGEGGDEAPAESDIRLKDVIARIGTITIVR